MPRKDHERLSGAKKGVEEPSTEEIPPVETWTKPAIEMTGEGVATVETWTAPAREITGESVAAVETWTVPARR
jgi:hypothetical protein